MHKGSVNVFKAKREGLNPDYKNTENLVMIEGIINDLPLSIIKEYCPGTQTHMLLHNFVEKTYEMDKGKENYSELDFNFEKLFDSRYIGDTNNGNSKLLTFDGNLSLEEQIHFFNDLTSNICSYIRSDAHHKKQLKEFKERTSRWSV